MLMYIKKSLIIGAVTMMSLSPLAVTSALAQNHNSHQNHTSAMLQSVNGSGVEGFVDLRQLRNNAGTRISLVAFGLTPEHTYVSLYYGNHICELEPYSADDVIGGIYTANSVGVGVTHGNATDNLDEVNSVSVRDSDNFNLLACADIHPGK